MPKKIRHISVSRAPDRPESLTCSQISRSARFQSGYDQFKTREFLRFMHRSETVSDTVTDFQLLQSRTIKTSVDLSGPSRVKSTGIRMSLTPSTSRNSRSCTKQVKISFDLYESSVRYQFRPLWTPKFNAPVSACLWRPSADFKESLVPKQGKTKFCSSYSVKNVPQTLAANFLNQIS